MRPRTTVAIPMPSFRAAALTDIGRIRQNNEDRVLFDEKSRCFGVADGVGGLPGGAEAAQLAVDQIAALMQTRPEDGRRDLVAIVRMASHAVMQLGQIISPDTGIGTTLTFGLVQDTALRIAHVGDSRCYLLRNGEIARLTEDHSVENEARMRRARGEVVFYHEGNRNALTRCVGQPILPEVDIIEQSLAAGDRYLFCTDGVTRMISDSELGAILARFDDPEAALAEIVGLAMRRGGPDNATAVLCAIDSL
jgi:serine/threonine protein phosphatase PrpC